MNRVSEHTCTSGLTGMTGTRWRQNVVNRRVIAYTVSLKAAQRRILRKIFKKNSLIDWYLYTHSTGTFVTKAIRLTFEDNSKKKISELLPLPCCFF